MIDTDPPPSWTQIVRDLIPHDKALHACYGAALSLVGAVVAHLVSQPSWTGALALPVLFGIGKEVWDRMGHGTPDPWDVVATVVGALPAVVAGFL